MVIVMKENEITPGDKLTKEIYLDLGRGEWESLSEATFKLKTEE